MKHLLCLLWLLTSGVVCSAVFSQTSSLRTNNSLLVELKPHKDTEKFWSDFEKQFDQTAHETVSINFSIYKISYSAVEINTAALIKFLQSDPRVEGISQNEPVNIRGTVPNDSFYYQQYYLNKISIPQLWDVTQGGATACGDSIVVAILDKGFDIKIPDFAGNIYQNNGEIPNNNIDDDKNGFVDDFQGYNFFSGNDNHSKTAFDSDPYHGTYCAGIVGARGNNNKGIAGVNWRTKMLFLSGLYSEEFVIKAYDYLYTLRKLYNDTKGAQGAFIAVTSLSLGIDKARPEDHLPWCNVYSKLGEVGILNVVAATDNKGDLFTLGDVPGLCQSPYLIVVNSTDATDKLTNISPTSATYIGISAPGTDIFSTFPTKAISLYDFVGGGNSFAAPQVAGVATLLYSLNDIRLCPRNFVSPADAALKIKNALFSGADKLISLAGTNISGGRLNAFKSFTNLTTLLPTVETLTKPTLRLFPNPTAGEITVLTNSDAQFNSIKFFDNLGRVLYLFNQGLNNDAYTFDLKSYPSGLYFLRYQTSSGITTEKIILQH